MSEPIRVVLADDHPTLRLGLRVLLDQAPDVAVVGEAEDGEQALTLLEMLLPDVVVLDCQLPKLDGTQVAQEIRRRAWSVQIVALSSYDDDRYVRGMLEAGAVGYLLKEEAPERVVEAVRRAASGDGCFISPMVAQKVATWARGQLPAGLTERELEVLRCVARGLTNREIAQTLDVTERTVAFHVSNVLEKLGVASRVKAAMWAREQGLIP